MVNAFNRIMGMQRLLTKKEAKRAKAFQKLTEGLEKATAKQGKEPTNVSNTTVREVQKHPKSFTCKECGVYGRRGKCRRARETAAAMERQARREKAISSRALFTLGENLIESNLTESIFKQRLMWMHAILDRYGSFFYYSFFIFCMFSQSNSGFLWSVLVSNSNYNLNDIP